MRGYFALVHRALREASHDHVGSIAAALAYYAFLALPSVLLVAVGLFSLFAGPHAVSVVVDRLGTVMPSQATTLIEGSIRRLTQRQTTGATMVAVGGLLAVWSLGSAMQNVMWGLNAAYNRDETRGFVHRRLTAWAMVAFVFVGFVVTFGMIVLGPHLSTWLGSAVGAKTVFRLVWWSAQWPLTLAGLLVAFAGVLYLGPDVEQRRWRFLSPGALSAVVIWLVGSGAFAYYTSRFGSYNKAWGSLAAVVVLLSWLWLSSLALLLGAEIDAEAERSRAERSRKVRSGRPVEAELHAPRKA